jgi:GNAT superfamily N-acetyltransferase
MIDSQNPNAFIYWVKRAITILRTDGPAGLLKRIKDRLFLKPHQKHCFVYGKKYCAELKVPIGEVEMEFREITAVDNDAIDELTAVDEWHISRSFTLEKLEGGEHIYIAKHEGRIVASQSIVTKDRFEDPFLGREFKIAPDEGYCWRAFCVPAFRGRGIFPALERYYLTDMALKYGRNNTLAIILTTNKSSQRMASKAGRVKVGRAGFFEIFGIRFHYLLGREAFKETRRRFLIRNIG